MSCNMFGLPEPVGDHPGYEEDVGNNDIDAVVSWSGKEGLGIGKV